MSEPTKEQELELRIKQLEDFNMELQHSNAELHARVAELLKPTKPTKEGAQWVLDEIHTSRRAGMSDKEVLIDLQTELELITGAFKPISSTGEMRGPGEKKPAAPAAKTEREVREGIKGLEEALDERERRQEEVWKKRFGK